MLNFGNLLFIFVNDHAQITINIPVLFCLLHKVLQSRCISSEQQPQLSDLKLAKSELDIE